MAKNQNGFTVWDEEFAKQFYTEEEIEENTLQARRIEESLEDRSHQSKSESITQ